ncbi:uncharacterized protein CEXT_654081 [Caerostris extrusa]|uniref:Cyclin-dependent kinase inhibitor domain-containing protein n=1 Tax=Caerostris extrusa TaxID=172846 RepID=A0AAV4RVI3_CAEEX|nr:uncharacterized protein CEXT_654081 [Caerostris extrusa]
MCTVQVLLFADGMGRPGDSQGGVRAGVCRRLFAEDPSTDPSSLLRSMEEQLRNRDKERWNFDFQTGTPLPGRYQWVAVGKASPAAKRTEERVVAEAVRPQTTKTSSTSVQASKGKKNRASTQSKITGKELFLCSMSYCNSYVK